VTATTHTVSTINSGLVEVSVDEQGQGQPFLLLHGGGGPNTVASFARTFAAAKAARIITPTHPGFEGTNRPDVLTSIAQLATLYVRLVDQLDLDDVTLIGNSIGGWIAAEMALLESPRVSGTVLVDAVGIDVPGHPIADFFSLSMDQVMTLSFHNPDPFHVDPAKLPPAAQAIAAGNRAALAVCGGAAMSDPSLITRLAHLEMPTLVLWADSDRIVDPKYGRAYASAIPMARFYLLNGSGHLPQIETPDQLIHAIWDAADVVFATDLSIAST